MHTIETDSVRVVLNPQGGHLHEVVFRAGGQDLRPLHRAPWVGSGEALPADTPTMLRNLAGDFFCAAFSTNDLDDGPPHGRTANGLWQPGGEARSSDAVSASFDLAETVFGASVQKQIFLRPGHPVVYQRHILRGGQGRVPMAHHAMIYAPGGTALSFSPKAFGITPPTKLEPDPAVGRSLLAYPQRFARLDAVQLAAGGTADLTRTPWADSHEDLVSLSEVPGARFGWSAALAVQDGFLFFAIKDAQMLPHTVLWYSNGGRDYPPWSGRHRAVLGIEEGCTFCHVGHRAALEPNPLTREGYPTALALQPDGVVDIRYAFGAIPAPAGWRQVTGIEIGRDELHLQGDAGATRVPFDAAQVVP